MLRKAKHIVKKTAIAPLEIFSLRKTPELKSADVAAARQYIENYWTKLQRYNPKDDGSLIGLPKPYLVPSHAEGQEFDYNEMYYWDSYFMVQGMLDADHKELVMGILENLIYLYKRFQVIPNGSQLYYVGRSQPPFLTSFIFDVYNAYKLDKDWLAKNIQVAKDEYKTVWMGTRKPNARKVHHGLSRYYDFNYLHDIAEAESGWDMNPRFGRKALNYLPVDLNCLLYKYEMDFAAAARIQNDQAEALKWETRAIDRKETMMQLMWDETRGLLYDYDYVRQKRGNVSSLASYYAMWAGMVDGREAQAMVRALKRFDEKGGLATTDSQLARYMPGQLPTQWAHPNGWAPLQFLVVKGLQRYGYRKDARRVALKWLKNNLDWFNVHGVFLEKYNVVAPEKPPLRGVYPSQTGFGWTNAVFERFCQEFIDGKNPFGGPVLK